MTLKKIPSICFKRSFALNNPLKYRRHHIYSNNKESIDPNKLVLTINKIHLSMEGRSDLIQSLIKERILWRESIPHHYKKIKNGELLWRKFLRRRDDIKNKGIEFFFRYYYPDVVHRFFRKITNGQLEYKIKQTIQVWMNEGNPEPLFPKYLQERILL